TGEQPRVSHRPSPGSLREPPSPKGRRVPSLALRASALTLLPLLCAGCSTYAERTLTLHNAYYDNQLPAAETAVAEQLKRDRGNADLIKLNRAMIELAEGNAAASERTLREVRDHFDHLEGPDALEKGVSFLTDDNSRAYAGEDYEKVLIRAFL